MAEVATRRAGGVAAFPDLSARPAVGAAPALHRATGRRDRLALAAILALALALRLVALAFPSIHHPDEIFQYLEPAHRLVFGYGVVPWEFKFGIRSWLLPLLLAGPMALGEAIAPGGSLYLLLPRLVAVLASLALPWSAWALGRRTSRTHGLVAAFVAAIWAEFVYFAPHTLSEQFAIAAVLPAAALLFGSADPTRRALAAAGALLALAGLVRFQFAPALLVLAVTAAGRSPARWTAIAAGGLATAGLGGLLDLAMGMVPFGWLVENVRQNLVQDRASHYGTLGPLGYVTWFEHLWNVWLLAIVPFVWLGMKRQPALFWAAIANVAFHSLIAHKEYRFVELSAALLVVLAAIGSVDAADRLRRRRPTRSRRTVLAGLAIGWTIASASMAAGREMRRNWSHASDTIALVEDIRRDAAACGVALLAPDMVEWGGYSWLHRPIPVTYYEYGDPVLGGRGPERALADEAARVNRILGRADGAGIPAGWTRRDCRAKFGTASPDICVYARPGGCRDGWSSPFLLERVFDRVDRQIRTARR